MYKVDTCVCIYIHTMVIYIGPFYVFFGKRMSILLPHPHF